MKPNTDRPLETELVEASFNNAYKEVMALGKELSERQAGVESAVATLASDVGDVTALTTEDKDNLVEAINEVDSHADTNANAISAEVSRATGVEGTLSNLSTSAKTNLVAAINEVDSHADANASNISSLQSGKQDKLSTAQMNAVNSGITADKVSTYDGYASSISGKQDALSTDQLKAVNSGITSTKVSSYDNCVQQLPSKLNQSAVADEFDPVETYQVGDYCMYEGSLYECIAWHHGVWFPQDFSLVQLVDITGGGGGGSVSPEAIAPEFDIATTYTSGEPVMYEGKLYACNVPSHTGAWDSNDFIQIEVASIAIQASSTAGNAVPASGNTTIAGTKTFSSAPKLSTVTSADYLKTDSSGTVSKGTVSTAPTASSTAPITSGAVYTALADKADLSVVADEFSVSTSYAVGDYCIHEGKLYRCIQVHNMGAWFANDFTETQVVDELGSGGGGSTDLIADEFSSTASYVPGDFVVYEGTLYMCTQNHQGAWSSGDFTTAGNVTDLIKSVNQTASAAVPASGNTTVDGTKTFSSAPKLSSITSANYLKTNSSGTVTKGTAETEPTSSSSNLITSGAVYAALQNKQTSFVTVITNQTEFNALFSTGTLPGLVFILPGSYNLVLAGGSITPQTNGKASIIGIGKVTITCSSRVTQDAIFQGIDGIENIDFVFAEGTQPYAAFNNCSNLRNLGISFSGNGTSSGFILCVNCTNLGTLKVDLNGFPFGTMGPTSLFSSCVGAHDCVVTGGSNTAATQYVGFDSCTLVRYNNCSGSSLGTAYSTSTPNASYTTSTYDCKATGNGGHNS